MNNPDCLENLSRSKVATLCAGSVYPLTGGNDSSKDYWRVTKDKDGKVVKIENDGSNNVTTVDENGMQTGFAEYTGGSKTGFLGEQIGLSAAETNTMLGNAGYSLNKTTGLFEGANAKQSFDITGINALLPGKINPTSDYYTQRVKDYQANARDQELLESSKRVQDKINIQSGNGDITTPYYTSGDPFVDQIQLSTLLGTKEVGPCFVSAAMDPFIQMGYSAQQVSQAIYQLKDAYLNASDAEVKNLPTMWSKMAEKLNASRYPAYYFEDDPLKTISAKQLESLNVSMALVALYDPNKKTTYPNHWMYQYKYNSNWYVADSWTKNDGIFGTWTGSTWQNTKPVYRPLKFKDR